MRITAQLIDGARAITCGPTRYDRDLNDIFAIQDEISKAIVEALKLKLLPEEKKAIEQRGTANVDAYNLYLMARQHWVSGGFGDPRREEAIVRLCSRATETRSGLRGGLGADGAGPGGLRFWHGRDEDALSRRGAGDRDQPWARRGSLREARYLEDEGRAEEAETQFRTALRLDPSHGK